jgi:hypothetical protein
VKDYEPFRHRLASRDVYHRRLIGAGRIGLALIAISLAIGIAGYAITEHLGLLDAFLDAAMILSGMGPIHEPQTVAGKLFAGLYALYSGFAVLGIAAIMFAPVVHRLFHRFHIADTDQDPRT